MVETKNKQYAFQQVENDMLDVKMYELQNGLKLFLSVNPSEPRIFTNIAVHAGSKLDPPETTGLAHYMEHMLFKGTSKIGTTNWEKEKELLDKIEALYEAHRNTTDPEERKAIYQEIDAVSSEAAKLVAPNEYDKLSSSIGAKSTNAYTWLDQTVYVNDIPANELEKWMQLESERFRMLALRLFHTELETVYEEFNINQDKDFRKVNKKIREELFPNHPYGTQTTIGSPEHLRNPSMKNIKRYFETYYVPNNMALVLSGDFVPEEAVALAEKYFGHYKKQDIPPFTHAEQPAVNGPVYHTVKGQEARYLSMAWRFGSTKTDDPLMLSLIQHMFFNQQAGLLDIQLNQQQKVLESHSWAWFYEDYSAFGFTAKPREGQSMQEAEALLLQQLDRFRKGDFPDWLIDACIIDFRLGDTRAMESNQARVGAMTQSFVLGIGWDRFANRVEWMSKRTKEEVVAFANKYLRDDNYVCIYKEEGLDPEVIKVEKPPITSIELTRDAQSEFGTAFLSTSSPELEPVFVDFEKEIQKTELESGVPFHYVHNPLNDLFRLNYIFEMGKDSDQKLALALSYLPYLGTDKYSPAELQEAFFKLGLFFEVHNSDTRSYITLQGLESSLAEGVELFEHLLEHVRSNEDALQNVISDVLTRRAHAKQDRMQVLRYAMSNYARYGKESSYTYRLPEAELRNLKAEELIERIQSLTSYEHTVYYHGQLPAEKVTAVLNQYHKVPTPLKPLLPAQKFIQLPTEHNKVYFLDYPIVQTDVMLVSRGTPQFNLEEHLMQELYNNYFGYGLSSIVFQEIRESRALAYSTFAYYSSPGLKERAHYLQAYVGTQPDKLPDAIPAMLSIINDMPVSVGQIEHARTSILRRIETMRTLPSRYYWVWRANKDQGIQHDLHRDIYEKMQHTTADDLIRFQQQYVKGRNYIFLVMGSKENIDLEYLKTFGPVEEVTLEDVFGY